MGARRRLRFFLRVSALSCTEVLLRDRFEALEARGAFDAVGNGVRPLVLCARAACREWLRPGRRKTDTGGEVAVPPVVDRWLGQQAMPTAWSVPATDFRDGPAEVGGIPASQTRLPVPRAIIEFNLAAKMFVRE